ncbi:cytochrome P450 [Streptomyces tropicalis]|uniref:Cytochrome P450 n=1 Tax=Streptomyces tropicalis TaxID=3034234 RepID=A0ABT6A1H6_9ACTN|nr:cytochrome P450 [Streptomyces tropicalis]MDF3298497.1 cytochrome P450 [Streptomyces tropicalis]
MGSPVTAPIDRRTLVSLFARLRTGGGQANPLPAYDRLMAMGEVVPAPWGGHLVTSYRLCRRILADKSWRVPDHQWRNSRNDAARWRTPASQQIGNSLPMLNAPLHTRVRGSVGNLFHPNSIAALEPSIENTVETLLDQFAGQLRQGPADFCALVSEELPVVTIGRWMGLPPSDYALLRDLTHDQVHTQELFPTTSQLALSDAATARLRRYFSDLIRERRRRPGNDPVSIWLRTWDDLEPDRSVADAAVHALALFMILAALETTSHVLSDAVRLLLESPGQLELLRRDPGLVPDAIEEVLRYDAPIHMISRVAGADTELGGVFVPAGEMVQLMAGAAHHDPAQYADPHRFDVRRRAPHLSFGAGAHYCLGSVLARLEAKVLLTSLIRRGMHLRISTPPQWAPRVAFRRLVSLHLTPA